MPKASEHQASIINKMIYMGDSGTGKTTSLLSLVKEGYKLRIWNFDNLLDFFLRRVRAECPEKLDNIEYMSFRDKMKATAMGPIIDGVPNAFVNALKAFDKWEDGSSPALWGPEYVAVIDSGTTMARSAFWWAKGMQGAAGIPEGVPTKNYDPRQSFFTAQQAFLNILSLLTAETFNTNVILIAHVRYVEQDNAVKGFPLAVGTAISSEIPSYFPMVVLATKTAGADPKRTIRLRSTPMIDLKLPKNLAGLELPMETGLATIFKGK